MFLLSKFFRKAIQKELSEFYESIRNEKESFIVEEIRRQIPEYVASREAFETAIIQAVLHNYSVFGESSKLKLSDNSVVNNALFNLSCGSITVEDWVFFGHNVSILTGTHDITKFGRERQLAIPTDGRDIIIKNGAWIASNATVIGPCTIGENSVIMVGSVVIRDVEPGTVVGGVPAKFIRKI